MGFKWNLAELGSGRSLVVGGVVVVSVGAAWALWSPESRLRLWLWRRRHPWVAVGRLDSIFIYPLKSGAAVAVDVAEARQSCIQSADLRDRCFVVWDGKRRLKLTAREAPILVTIQTSIEGPCVTMTAKDDSIPELILNTDTVTANNDVRQISLWWADKIDALDCGDWAGSWMESLTGRTDLRLLFHAPDGLRSARAIANCGDPIPRLLARPDKSIFQDLSACMGLSTASLDDISGRLGRTLDARQFRPNLVFGGVASGFAEDGWVDVRIGAAEWRNVKRCTRCVMTTVDPDSGQKDAGREPLETLRGYRVAGADDPDKSAYRSAPLFGINLALDHPGHIHTGDIVYARC